MSSKPTKVPVMKPDQPYEEWKKELRIWEVTNLTLGVEKKIQAGTLFQALEGIPRQTVLSELTVEQITDEEGVKNILQTLDCFYLGNETQNAFNVIDELLNFKCKPDITVENFIIEFQLKVNKVKANGTKLSDGILGYALLKAANLPSDKHDMVKATCDELNYKNVKSQIEKIGLSKNKSSKFSTSKEATSNVKIEQCFCGNLSTNASHDNNLSESSSDEEMNKATAFYAGENHQSNRYNPGRKVKVNSTDRFGHVRACAFCKCHYHWLADCPYAPVSVKNEVANKYKYKYNNQKTL